MLNPGETTEIKGSGAKPYVIKNHDGVIWSCTCPGWRNCGGAVEKKSCKHLRQVRGDAAEAARIGSMPAIAQAGTTTARVSSAAPNTAVGPATAATVNGRVVTADADYAQTILDRAAKDGRKLRQDEKTKLHGPAILLAHKYEDFPDLDPTGWWYSEKLDGVRALWTGKEFLSRQGNRFHAPDWFVAGLPNHLLDGELWLGRSLFQKTISVVKRLDGGDMWKQVKYVVFDAPHLTGKGFEERLEALEAICTSSTNQHIKFHPHHKVQSRKHLLDELKAVAALGGEGLMIRKPGALYEAGRSATILKVKPWKDLEVTVRGHEPGKGRHKGRLGGLLVELENGKTFNVGTGLTDSERNNPPLIGCRVTIRYTELTDDGIPKCASFIAVRDYE